DRDVLFAGPGNDDLIGGSGTNSLYAWSRNPAVGGQFGIFVDELGNRFDDSGDFVGAIDDEGNAIPDGRLDDTGQPARVPEDTGLNRIVGNRRSDALYGGTGIDFLYGGGGNDTLYRANGSDFESQDNGLAGEAWKEYARETDQIWYVGATNKDDVISVDFVTEPGRITEPALLTDHHLVTRLTNNDGNFSFAAQVRLDFSATDADNNLIWDPVEILELDGLRTDDSQGRTELLDDLPTRIEQGIADLIPSEGDFLAILIDALDGNDQITVGPTVQKTVWVDAGPGDDRVEILAGNSILIDQAEFDTRNDTETAAFSLPSAAVVAPAGPAPTNGILPGTEDASFILTINDSTEATITLRPDQTNGQDDGTAANFAAENSTQALVDDINAALDDQGIADLVTAFLGPIGDGQGIFFATTKIAFGETSLRITVDEENPASRWLGLQTAVSDTQASIASNTVYDGLSIDSPNDEDWFRFTLNRPATLTAPSLSKDDGLSLTATRTDVQAEAQTGDQLDLQAGDYVLRVKTNLVPTLYSLSFKVTEDDSSLTLPLGTRSDQVRRDVILGGPGNDILSGGPAEDWIFGGTGNDVLSGGLDRQAPDLLYGQAGDDTFQLIADDLPTLTDSNETFVPTFTDEFNGGDGDDRVFFLGGDFDRLGNEVRDFASLRYNRFLHRYEFTNLVWDIQNQAFVQQTELLPSTLIARHDITNANLGGDAVFTISIGETSGEIIAPHQNNVNGNHTADNDQFDISSLVSDINAAIFAENSR
ncbi:MAG: hypothetical protein AAGJ83_11015, partial [Planctomycetota bacterium]